MTKRRKPVADMRIPVEDAFAMFSRKVGREKRVPFRILPEVDPFYSESNMDVLRQSVKEAD